MPEQPESADWPRPDWAERMDLIAVAVDLVSERRYRVWYDRGEATRPVRRLRRGSRRPLFVEDVQTGMTLARCAEWSGVVAWHDSALISSGWTMLREFPEPQGNPAAEPIARPSSPPSRV